MDNTLLRITDFARAAGVTARLLRHYDSLGLFKPAHVDADTGYRYYRLEQLSRLHRIISLRTLGLPLHEIGTIVSGEPPQADILRSLQAQYERLERHIAHDRARLREIHSRLVSVDRNHGFLDVIVKPLASEQGLRASAYLEGDESIPSLFDQGSQALREWGLYSRVQAIVGMYPRHTLLEQKLIEPFPFEAVWVMPTARVRPIPLGQGRTLVPTIVKDATAAACALHYGPYERLFDTYRAILNYIQVYEYRISGAPREVYHQHQRASGELITEVQIPISDQGVSSPLNVPT